MRKVIADIGNTVGNARKVSNFVHDETSLMKRLIKLHKLTLVPVQSEFPRFLISTIRICIILKISNNQFS